MKNTYNTFISVLLYCELFLTVAEHHDLKIGDLGSHFSFKESMHRRKTMEMYKKKSNDFDTITFALDDSETPLLVTEALHESVKNNLYYWLFSSSKIEHFDTVTSFVHIEKSNKETVYCPLRDDLSKSNIQEMLDDNCESSGSWEIDDGLQNYCGVVNFPAAWPPTNQSGIGGWVSLWVYFTQLEPSSGECWAARMPLSRGIGEKIVVPELMRDFDLTLIDWQSSYMLYLHASTTFEASSTDLPEVARVLCVVEGSGTALVYPLDESGQSVGGQQQTTNGKYFSGSFEEFDCLLVPKFWEVEVQSSTPTSLLLMSWQDEVTFTEEFIQLILTEEESSVYQDHGLESRVPVVLSGYMPPAERSTPTVWLDEPKAPYIFGRFLSSKRSELSLDEFVDLIKLDANIFPSLVDCPPNSECYHLLRQIFIELDFNGDGFLNESDLFFLTPAKYEHLSNELDDLIQEVIDVATDQWEEALEARTSTKASQWIEFANRAQEKKLQSATKTAQRIARGDLSVEEIATIRENLPGLYEELIEYGKIEPLE